MRKKFRFEDMAIWQRSRDLAVHLNRSAEDLEGRHLYRYAEQLLSSMVVAFSASLDNAR